MNDFIKKCFTVLQQGMHSLKNCRNDKREYKKYLQRIEALPQEYRYVFEKATEYMWQFSGGGDGYDMVLLQADLLDLFEAGAAEQRPVFDLIGEDVTAFCDALLINAKTYTENARQKLNNDIAKKLRGSTKT